MLKMGVASDWGDGEVSTKEGSQGRVLEGGDHPAGGDLVRQPDSIGEFL